MSYVSAYVYVFELKILWGYPESQWVNVEIRQLKCFSTWYTINSSIFCLDLFNGLEARLGHDIVNRQVDPITAALLLNSFSGISV